MADFHSALPMRSLTLSVRRFRLAAALLSCGLLGGCSRPESVQTAAEPPVTTSKASAAAPVRSVVAVPTVFDAAVLRHRATQEEARARSTEGLGSSSDAAELAIAFAAFGDWWDAYATAPDDEARAELLPTGIAAAQARQAAMAALIRLDPALALQLAVSPALRAAAPVDITVWFENTIEGTGRFEVDISCGLPASDHTAPEHAGDVITRTLTVDDTAYAAYVYGERRSVTTKHALAFHGIAVGSVAALAESALRLPSPGEEVPAGDGVPYRLAGEWRFAASLDEVHTLADELAAAEQELGADGSANSPWSEGAKTLLYIRIAYSDAPTVEPISMAQATTHQNNVALFYAANSYGATSVTSTITPLIVLPQDTAYYAGESWTVLLADARAAALAAGYNHADYSFYTVASPKVSTFTWAGRAFIGGAGSHLNGDFTLRVSAHELGHNFGLYHANYNYTPSENPQAREPYTAAPDNSPSQQYGHRYHMMGASGSTTAYHFSAREKVLLDWLPPEDHPIILTSGTYRMYRHDHADATGLRGLRIPAGDATRAHYWLSFRRNFPSLPVWSQGAEVLWGRTTNVSDGTLLLDMTPFSNDGNHSDSSSADNNDKADAALAIGRMYGNPDSGAWFTILDQGGLSPQEYLDVAVEIGNFTGNRPPVVSLEASATSTGLNQPVTLTASASDPDGDPVVLGWDYGDGTFAGNLTQVTPSWNSTRQTTVRVTAVDRRGGRASAHAVITVGNPTTHTISGRVLHDGQPVEGVRVFNGRTGSSYRGTYSDRNGAFSLSNLAADDYALEARATGYRFGPDGFANPVEVAGPVTDLTFIASTAPAPYVIVDNTDPTGVEITATSGNWVSLSSAAGFFGSDYITDNNTSKGGKSVTFRPQLPADGFYRVYVRHTQSTNRADNVPIDVIHAAGTNTFTVSQKVNGGLWNYLGAFAFEAAGEAAVRIRNDDTNGHVAADSVKFELTTDQDPSVRLLTVADEASEAGQQPALLRLEREGQTGEPLTVYLAVDATAEGAATPGVDYVALPTVHTFAEGETSFELPVVPLPDEEAEGPELILAALRDQPGPTQEWEFDDAVGTELNAAANTVAGGALWTDALGDSTVVSGGLFRIRRVAPGNANSWVELPSTPTRWIYAIMETGGWNFTGTAANETVRFGFTTGANTTVVGQLVLARSDTGILLSGQALGTGATDIPAVMLTPSSTTTDRYTLVVAVHVPTLTYRVSHRRGTEPFTSIGNGTLAAGRVPSHLRLALVNTFASTSAERFDLARLAISDADPTAPTYRMVAPSEAVITLLDDPRDDWRWRLFPAEDLGNPARSGWDADPNHDGFNNLAAYAFGLHPLQNSGASPFTSGLLTDGDHTYLTVRLRRPVATDAVSVVVEATGDLTNPDWTEAAVPVGVPEPSEEPGYEDVLYRDVVPATEGPRFLRPRATLLPAGG